MENQLVKNQNNNTTLVSGMTSSLIPIIKNFNCLTAYPYSDEQFEIWANIILMSRPHTTKNEILNVIQKLAVGIDIQVDTKLGVQNILKHLFTKQEIQDAENRRLEEEIANITN